MSSSPDNQHFENRKIVVQNFRTFTVSVPMTSCGLYNRTVCLPDISGMSLHGADLLISSITPSTHV